MLHHFYPLRRNQIFACLFNLHQRFLISFLLFCVTACSQNVDQQINESRLASLALGSQLKEKLQNTLTTEGPIETLAVCTIEAGKITSKISNDMLLEVGRTSLKPRNSANAPDSWEASGLLFFEEQLKFGMDVKKLETYEVVKDDNGKWFRYMKGIPTSEVCLVCHGEAIAEPVQQKITSLYPDDQATGFKVGDLRGAFSVTIELQ